MIVGVEQTLGIKVFNNDQNLIQNQMHNEPGVSGTSPQRCIVQCHCGFRSEHETHVILTVHAVTPCNANQWCQKRDSDSRPVEH